MLLGNPTDWKPSVPVAANLRTRSSAQHAPDRVRTGDPAADQGKDVVEVNSAAR